MEAGRGVRAVVCGGRDFLDQELVDRTLDGLGITVLIEGGAHGADRLASAWAFRNRVPCARYKADWVTCGKRAGPIRNQQMLTEGKPGVVVAFPGGRGTADMVRRARLAGVHVVEVKS